MNSKIKNIHQSLVTGFLPLLLFIFFFVLIRFVDGCEWLDIIVWITVGIQLCIAFLLLYLTQVFSIIRERSFLPASVYLLFVGTDTLQYNNWEGSLFALGVLICFYFIFYVYQNSKSQGGLFCISIILTLGSLWWSPYLLVFPLFWYGFYQFKNLDLRTFFAGILGFLLVYLFLFAVCLYKDNLPELLVFLPDTTSFRINFFDFNLQDSLALAYIALLFIFSVINVYFAGISEKVKAIKTLLFLHSFSFFIFLFFILLNQWSKEWVAILYLSVSLPISHYFTIVKKSSTVWLLFFTILFFLGMFVWQNYFQGS